MFKVDSADTCARKLLFSFCYLFSKPSIFDFLSPSFSLESNNLFIRLEVPLQLICFLHSLNFLPLLYDLYVLEELINQLMDVCLYVRSYLILYSETRLLWSTFPWTTNFSQP
jgi:hypothetical protein